ncbi:TetR/AcrR family transcriptional regulator [Promicromonospora citrea]|uniref:Putative TetR-family transcriptional regulator n=1 Tax=Promicromonospora citrea TaxID=43677 RepID=A0A8H9L443_9MICO|nr:TetR/AcrR family transcriptional regulator [Promicromonospora citrea]NNH55085.1 TetR family transcriptional regulator [Promicromonospora citrea]GGM31934.1 putative TetR-family transcriptional regulator [Promicromonospora citrea]
MSYHHGDLRRAMIDAAAAAVAERGPAALSLRELARLAGVSHAAPAHHFGDKAGVLTAVAAEGFTLLADALATAGGDLLAAGLAYVRFAAAHPGHFAVMFDPGLVHGDDPVLAAARDRAGDALAGLTSDAVAARAAWSVAHGFASLWLSGALTGTDAAAAAEPVLRRAVAGGL